MEMRIGLAPNPASGSVTVSFMPSHSDPGASIAVIDPAGRELYAEHAVMIKGQLFKRELDLTAFRKEVVLVRFKLNGIFFYRKLVVL